MFAGQMACEALNFLLKRLIKEERPKRLSAWSVVLKLTTNTACWAEMYGKGYGMPSSHAQFMSFFSIYLALFLLFRHSSPPSRKSLSYPPSPAPLFHRVIVSILTLTFATFVAASRVYLNYHTPRQVLIGCTAGALSAMAWFVITEWARNTGLLRWILDMYICKTLRIRDLVVEEDLVEAGWREWQLRQERRRETEKNKMAGERKVK